MSLMTLSSLAYQTVIPELDRTAQGILQIPEAILYQLNYFLNTDVNEGVPVTYKTYIKDKLSFEARLQGLDLGPASPEVLVFAYDTRLSKIAYNNAMAHSERTR